MSANLKTVAVVGTLAIGALLAVGASQTFYYPSAGYYVTTAGSVYIPAPGYYSNVPAGYAATPSYGYGYAPAPRYSYSGPSYGYGYRPSAGSSARRGGGPNSPPYYSGAQHSLHGRGFDSGRHGR